MSGYQKFIAEGRLVADPETRTSGNGNVITNFRLAVDNLPRNGEKQAPEYISVVAFGKVAGVAQEYLRKGARALIDGRLQTRKWQDKEGRDRYTTEVVLFSLDIIDFPERDEGGRDEDDGQDDDLPF